MVDRNATFFPEQKALKAPFLSQSSPHKGTHTRLSLSLKTSGSRSVSFSGASYLEIYNEEIRDWRGVSLVEFPIPLGFESGRQRVSLAM